MNVVMDLRVRLKSGGFLTNLRFYDLLKNCSTLWGSFCNFFFKKRSIYSSEIIILEAV